jgi:hypothetical protein
MILQLSVTFYRFFFTGLFDVPKINLKKGYQQKFNAIRNKKGELAMNTKEKQEI